MTVVYIRAAIASALFGVTVASGAYAETADKGVAAGGLDEIVVTATRREERLQDVPISISAFSQDKLDSQGLKNIDDVSRLSPGITFTRNGTGSSANYNDENSDINIRGVDSTAGTSTTGIYVDDTPVQSRHIGFGSINIFPALFDLDRVEVLRGPQGTLFGAGAEGGAVRFITPQPSLDRNTGYMRAELSTTRYGDPSYEAGAAFGGPIVEDKLGFRVSASYRRDGGWVDRVAYTLDDPMAANPNPSYASTVDKAANWQQTLTLRAALTWKVSDTFKITPSVYYQRLHINDTATYWDALSNPSAGVFRNGNALPNDSTDPFTLAAIKAEWNLGFADLTSNTSYLARDQHATSDYSQYLNATWNYFGLLPNTFPQGGALGWAPFQDVQRNFYQEIRLASSDPNARLKWTTGLFFSHLNENIPEDIYAPLLNQQTFIDGVYSLCTDALPCPNGLIYTGHESRVKDKQIAAFGEVVYKLTDTVTATVGLRVSKVDYTGSFRGTGPFLGETIDESFSASEHAVTPKAVLAWSPDHDNMYYASASKGFRPGGVNTGVGGICDGDLNTLGLPIVNGRPKVPDQYNSDSLWSYEIGAKNTLFDRRLQVNASIFFIDWKDIQQNVYLPSCGEQFTANLGKAESKGGDIDVTFRPVEEMTFNLTVAYTDAQFTKTSCAGVLVYDGTRCQPSPVLDPVYPIASKGDALLGSPWSVTAAAEYHFARWQDRLPYVRVDYQHTSAQTKLLPTQNENNALFDNTIPGLPVTNNLDLRAGLRFNGLDLSLFVNNLTDAHPLMFQSRDIAAPSDTLYFDRGVRPRTFGVTATYRY